MGANSELGSFSRSKVQVGYIGTVAKLLAEPQEQRTAHGRAASMHRFCWGTCEGSAYRFRLEAHGPFGSSKRERPKVREASTSLICRLETIQLDRGVISLGINRSLESCVRSRLSCVSAISAALASRISFPQKAVFHCHLFRRPVLSRACAAS